MPQLHLRSIKLPPELAGPISIDAAGLPRFWPIVWADCLQAANQWSTRSKALTAIDRLYAAAAEQFGHDHLDQILAARDFKALEDVLTGFLIKLRTEGIRDERDYQQTWARALQFIGDVLRHMGASEMHDCSIVMAGVQRLERLYSQISPTPERAPAPIRALPAEVVEDLYAIFRPGSDRNPFKGLEQQLRNQLILSMLLHLGLRRSELCLLPVDAIRDERDPVTGTPRYWINIDRSLYENEDSRFTRPAIKTEHSRRPLPLASEVVALCDTYTTNYRQTCQHPFLLNSQKNAPLSLPRLTAIFSTASSALSPSATKVLADYRNAAGNQTVRVTPHDLRHTAAVYRLSRYMESGISLDQSIEKLRVFFGWSPNSQMPRRYARAYFETALAEVWHDKFDLFVDTLRALEGHRR